MRHVPFHRTALELGVAIAAFAGTTHAWAQTPPAPPAAAPEPAAPAPNYKVQYNGLVDVYYQFQFNNPRFKGVPNDLNVGPVGRVYDVRHNAPTLSLAELNILRTPRPGGFGFKSTLIGGDTADINHFNFPPGGANDGKGEARYKNVQQLYLSYAFKGAGGGVDFGKFYTPIGYEVTESNGNNNYSRSFPFFLLPTYNAGLHAYTPSYKGLVIHGWIVNAVFNTATAGVQDDNGRPSIMAQLNYTEPKGKYTAVSTWGFGTDKLGGVNNRVLVSDNDLTWNFTAKTAAGLNYLFIKQDPRGGAPKTTDNGYAVYWRNQVTPKTAYAVRFSGFRSKTPVPAPGISTIRPWEGTLTYEMKPLANILTRVEYRHDGCNTPAFAGRDSAPSKKSQDSLTVAGIYTF